MNPFRITTVAKAIAHPARIRILDMLSQGELCGCEFAPVLDLDASVVSRHLAQLSRSGLIASRRDGVRVMWHLSDPSILEVLQHLERLPLPEDGS